MRLDVALVERGLVETRAAAQRLVMAGLVFSNDRRLEKAGQPVADDMPIEVRGQLHPYVSRGGLKLEKALDHFAIPVTGRTALDVGSSTGGFTDCLLQRGAAKVYAVDVGTNQLAWKLRSDPRVVSMEKTNIRDVTRAEIPEPIDLVVCDASFVGLRLVLPAALALAAANASSERRDERRSCTTRWTCCLDDAAFQAVAVAIVASLRRWGPLPSRAMLPQVREASRRPAADAPPPPAFRASLAC